MINSDDSIDILSAQQLVFNWIDSESWPSPLKIETRDWIALPVPDSPNVMEMEWLSNAILETGNPNVIGISFAAEGGEVEEIVKKQVGKSYHVKKHQVDKFQIITAGKENLLQLLFDYVPLPVLLTNQNNDFLLSIGNTSDFYILCGSPDFMKTACPYSYDTAEILYGHWAYDEYDSTEIGRKEYARIWNKYAHINRKNS